MFEEAKPSQQSTSELDEAVKQASNDTETMGKQKDVEKEMSAEKADNIQSEKNAESEEDGWTVLQKEASQKQLHPTLPESEKSNANSVKDTNQAIDTVAPH